MPADRSGSRGDRVHRRDRRSVDDVSRRQKTIVEVEAHIRHPLVDGGSLCGLVTRLVPCKACEARMDSMLRVHIHSPRRPGQSLCGRLLAGDGIQPIGTAGSDPPPMYVSADMARVLSADRASALRICPGCAMNMIRLDEAETRSRSGSLPDPGSRRRRRRILRGDRRDRTGSAADPGEEADPRVPDAPSPWEDDSE